MIFIDTSVWIDYFRGRNTSLVATVNRLLDDDAVALAAPVWYEILSGASRKDLAPLKRVLSALPRFFPSEAAWPSLEDWIARAAPRGQRFGFGDLLIAVISAEQKGALWSLDRDFRRMQELGWVELWEP